MGAWSEHRNDEFSHDEAFLEVVKWKLVPREYDIHYLSILLSMRYCCVLAIILISILFMPLRSASSIEYANHTKNRQSIRIVKNGEPVYVQLCNNGIALYTNVILNAVFRYPRI